MIRENALSIRELTVGGLFAALITAGAWVKITLPTQPLPMHFTLQFFFVLLSALLMGAERSLASVGTYLTIGLCGVPVFASGGGPAYLLRPTFGFLIGFLNICCRPKTWIASFSNIDSILQIILQLNILNW